MNAIAGMSLGVMGLHGDDGDPLDRGEMVWSMMMMMVIVGMMVMDVTSIER